MKIGILGCGLAGSTIAHLLQKKNHEITIFEKESIGGLCLTQTYKGINYDLGPHILYTDKQHIKEFLNGFINNRCKDFYQYVSIDGKMDNLKHFPVTVDDVISINPKAGSELYKIEQSKPDYSTFESFLLSQVGRTAYEYFFKNYNIKQWGIHPRKMETEWAKQRKMFLRDRIQPVFGDKWQGHPGTYNILFEKLTNNSKIIYENITDIDIKNCTVNSKYHFDFIINTTAIDQLLEKQSILKYRGIHWVYVLLQQEYALPTYLTSFPNNYSFTRIMEYKHETQQIDKSKTLIGFEFPYDPTDPTEPAKQININESLYFCKTHFEGKIDSYFDISKDLVYPVAEKQNIEMFWNLIQEKCLHDNFITMGRLGLYSYISIDTCIDQCMKISDIFDKWTSLNSNEKLDFYKSLRERQT